MLVVRAKLRSIGRENEVGLGSSSMASAQKAKTQLETRANILPNHPYKIVYRCCSILLLPRTKGCRISMSKHNLKELNSDFTKQCLRNIINQHSTEKILALISLIVLLPRSSTTIVIHCQGQH